MRNPFIRLLLIILPAAYCLLPCHLHANETGDVEEAIITPEIPNELKENKITVKSEVKIDE